MIKEEEKLTLQTPESFRARFNIEVRVENEAVAIDPARKCITVRDLKRGATYEESYDSLILSPGAAPILPDIPGVDGENVFTLRKIPDTFEITEYIKTRRPKTAAVVGGGYIGVEMAENLVGGWRLYEAVINSRKAPEYICTECR